WPGCVQRERRGGCPFAVLGALGQVQREPDDPEQQAGEEPTDGPHIGEAPSGAADAQAGGVDAHPDARADHGSPDEDHEHQLTSARRSAFLAANSSAVNTPRSWRSASLVIASTTSKPSGSAGSGPPSSPSFDQRK